MPPSACLPANEVWVGGTPDSSCPLSEPPRGLVAGATRLGKGGRRPSASACGGFSIALDLSLSLNFILICRCCGVGWREQVSLDWGWCQSSTRTQSLNTVEQQQLKLVLLIFNFKSSRAKFKEQGTEGQRHEIEIDSLIFPLAALFVEKRIENYRVYRSSGDEAKRHTH